MWCSLPPDAQFANERYPHFLNNALTIRTEETVSGNGSGGRRSKRWASKCTETQVFSQVFLGPAEETSNMSRSSLRTAARRPSGLRAAAAALLNDPLTVVETVGVSLRVASEGTETGQGESRTASCA